MKTFETNITKSYLKLYLLYLTAEPVSQGLVKPGIVQVRLKDDATFSVEGTLDHRGWLTGMAKLFEALVLKEGDKVTFEISSDGEVLILSPKRKDGSQPAVSSVSSPRKLRWSHIEPFRPENLRYWEPKYETDVYLAFGVLQKFTKYQYCCGTSKEFLKGLGYDSDVTKPDAILLNTSTNDYAVAEFKMRSSDFATNHQKEEIDVLVVWDDDVTDRQKLPAEVINLREVAREAAMEVFEE